MVRCIFSHIAMLAIVMLAFNCLIPTEGEKATLKIDVKSLRYGVLCARLEASFPENVAGILHSKCNITYSILSAKAYGKLKILGFSIAERYGIIYLEFNEWTFNNESYVTGLIRYHANYCVVKSDSRIIAYLKHAVFNFKGEENGLKGTYTLGYKVLNPEYLEQVIEAVRKVGDKIRGDLKKLRSIEGVIEYRVYTNDSIVCLSLDINVKVNPKYIPKEIEEISRIIGEIVLGRSIREPTPYEAKVKFPMITPTHWRVSLGRTGYFNFSLKARSKLKPKVTKLTFTTISKAEDNIVFNLNLLLGVYSMNLMFMSSTVENTTVAECLKFIGKLLALVKLGGSNITFNVEIGNSTMILNVEGIGLDLDKLTVEDGKILNLTMFLEFLKYAEGSMLQIRIPENLTVKACPQLHIINGWYSWTSKDLRGVERVELLVYKAKASKRHYKPAIIPVIIIILVIILTLTLYWLRRRRGKKAILRGGNPPPISSQVRS